MSAAPHCTPPTPSRPRPVRTDTLWIFDLDGTLIGSVRSDVLRPGAVELLDALAAGGSVCALWSAGGADYARRMAERHGLADRFVAIASKSVRSDGVRWDAPPFGWVPATTRRVYVDDAIKRVAAAP